MLIALTRPVSPSIALCELTYLERQPIDLELAYIQHEAYEACLARLGCVVQSLPVEPDLPDSVFIEDIAVVLDEIAVITQPGAASRRPEIPSVAHALKPYRELCCIEEPGTLDGGDVLRLGRTLYVGISGRSNSAGIEQLRGHVEPFGYSVEPILVNGCLHLKSAVTEVAENTLLINPTWITPEQFGDRRLIAVDAKEPHAANALLLRGVAILPEAYPATLERLQAADVPTAVVDVSELAKAEGALTCCSLIFEV